MTGRSQNAISSSVKRSFGNAIRARACACTAETVATALASGTPAIKARGEDEQQHDHQCVDDEAADLRQVVLARNVEHAEDQCGNERALDRPRSADAHH